MLYKQYSTCGEVKKCASGLELTLRASGEPQGPTLKTNLAKSRNSKTLRFCAPPSPLPNLLQALDRVSKKRDVTRDPELEHILGSIGDEYPVELEMNRHAGLFLFGDEK